MHAKSSHKEYHTPDPYVCSCAFTVSHQHQAYTTHIPTLILPPKWHHKRTREISATRVGRVDASVADSIPALFVRTRTHTLPHYAHTRTLLVYVCVGVAANRAVRSGRCTLHPDRKTLAEACTSLIRLMAANTTIWVMRSAVRFNYLGTCGRHAVHARRCINAANSLCWCWWQGGW